MKIKIRKAVLTALAVVLAFGLQSMPVMNHFGFSNQAFGEAANISSKLVGTTSVTQGDNNAAVTVEVQNNGKNSFTFDSAVLGVDPAGDIAVTGGTSGTVTLSQNQKTTILFYLNVNRFATTGKRTLSLTLRSGGTVVHENVLLGKLSIYEKMVAPDNDLDNAPNYVAALDILYSIKPSDGFYSNSDNQLALEVANFGNTIIKNAVLTLTLPDGLYVANTTNSVSLGYLSVGSTKDLSFSIGVEDNTESKNYAVSAELTGLDFANKEVSLKKSFYIPVNGAGTSSLKNIEITHINTPEQVLSQEDFNLSFQVENRNNAQVKNIKIDVETPEGILNKTKNTFIESAIPANGSKTYSVTLYAESGAKAKAYPIKISVSSSTAEESKSDTVLQYASVFVKGSGDVKTPQLMVDQYEYGGTYVQAGEVFLLEVGLYNTSGAYNLSNIKVTLSSDDGTFIPVNSSNSFYIDELKSKGHTSQGIVLSVKPDAEQKTTALTVDMSYEDGSGNAFTSKDIISIPVMQETRLVIDDIIAPPELYSMMQTGVSVQFYNMGKTVLNNLRVNVEGDFDQPQSNSYYVGNMEAGKSDSYDFTFIPRQSGPMSGKVIFSYEDASGQEQMIERPFEFQVMEEMPMPDDGMYPDEMADQGGSKWKPFVVSAIVVLFAGGGIFFWKRHRKKKINREMEIDE